MSALLIVAATFWAGIAWLLVAWSIDWLAEQKRAERRRVLMYGAKPLKFRTRR